MLKKFTPTFTPLALLLACSIFAFLYVFMEWLFIVTKPSFLQSSPFLDKFLILLNSSSLFSLLSIIVVLPFALFSLLFCSKKFRSAIALFTCAVPAFILSALVLLLVDNFTYTLFKVGVVTSSGFVRGLYLVLFILLFVFLWTRVFRFTNFIEEVLQVRSTRTRKKLMIALLITIAFFLCIPMLLDSPTIKENTTTSQTGSASRSPNIILITADSLNADVLSVYGYEEETTPFLEQIADESLVALNAFSNAQGTIGSLASLLTGRYPTDIQVIHSTDILRGEDATLHLPAILRERGYYSVQLSYSYYADARNLNIQAGFDEANGRKLESNLVYVKLAELYPSDYSMFIQEISNRILDRLGHIFFIRDMSNPYKKVTEGSEKFNDIEKVSYAINLLDTIEKPLFIHIHWMGTHGPQYQLENQVFSAGKDPALQKPYSPEFYQDSILELDTAVEVLYHALDERDLLGDSIIVIASDHTQRWSISRLPLIIRFPGGEYSGQILENVQNLDIAPTLLDYLGITQPDWMAGQSLISDLPAEHPVFIAAIANSTRDKLTGKVVYPEPEPPFYQFGKISVVLCDRWYQVNLTDRKLTEGKVNQHAGECSRAKTGRAYALSLIMEHLEAYGYDPSSLADIYREE